MPAQYDSFARHYDKALKPFERRFLAKWRAETLGLLPVDAVILEIGAGTGANFEHYPNFREAAASELSYGMIEFARRRCGSIRLVQSDAHALPFPASHFDAAFATLVFCSVDEPETAFAEIVRVVKPGGRVVLLEHVRPENWLGPVFDLMSLLTSRVIDDHFDRRTAEIAHKGGLDVIEVRKKVFGIVNLIVCRTPHTQLLS